MKNEELVLKLLKKNNGILKTEELKSLGVNSMSLTRLLRKGIIVRIDRGLYMDSTLISDEYYIFQHRCKKAIFSHSTALYFHDLSDRTPLKFMVTIPSGYNTRLLTDKKYIFSYIKKGLYELGKETVVTPFGNQVFCYNVERTICDIIKDKNKIDPSLFTDALNRYVQRKDNNYIKLYEYAEKLKIKEEVKKYMEVLIK